MAIEEAERKIIPDITVFGEIAICDPVVYPAGEDMKDIEDPQPARPDAALPQEGDLPYPDAGQGAIQDQQQYMHIFCR
jgi:hypothetical protein